MSYCNQKFDSGLACEQNYMYRNLLKVGPSLQIPFWNQAKRAFLSKVRPPIYTAVHAVMLSKKHRRSSTERVYDKRGIAESLHAYINKARLRTVCEVATTLENTPTPLFEEPLI